MTRPHIIRADTIDLQDQDSPSAKDHTRQPAHPAPYGEGRPAPHQERALRNAEQETAVELHHTRSPRVSQDLSGKELQLLQEDGDGYVNPDLIIPHQDQQVQRNGGTGGEADSADAEGDDGLEDELMDKISSSPSIDEAQKEQDADRPSEVHHHQGGYEDKDDDNRSQQTTADDSFSSELRDQVGPLISEQQPAALPEEWRGLEEPYGTDMDPTDFRHLLLPSDDPLLDNSFDDADISTTSSDSASAASGSSDASEGSADDEDGSGYGDDDDDDTEDVSFKDDPRYIDSGWGGECLRDTEDIDFEFVYALHTFIATVEGQANATKGDTMVLLDDSNSYWWLVRVVKDSSIGYLPAEHIETPTERLARLNKHRNVDLTAKNLLDEQRPKSRNPLKKAMKRGTGKTVQFTAPTYVEASDVDYSTEEEEEEGEAEYVSNEEERSEHQEAHSEPRQDDESATEPLKAGVHGPESSSEPQAQAKQSATSTDQNNDVDKVRTSDEMFDYTDDGPSSKSRNGTVRNTDSFFKDESTETRKINLTPSLLRDDSNGSLKNRPSIESFEKGPSSPEKSKDDKKRKEKKGMLSGFFKRKDKKGRNLDESTEDGDKVSEEILRQSPQSGPSLDVSKDDVQASRIGSQQQPQRQTSKLQKSPPSKLSPRGSASRGEPQNIKTVMTESERIDIPQPSRSPPKLNMEFESAPLVDPASQQLTQPTAAPADVLSRTDVTHPESTEMESPKDSRRGMFSPLRDALRSSPSLSEPKPEKAKKAKHRMPIDDFDSSSETDEQPEPSDAPEQGSEAHKEVEAVRERLSESPVQVSPEQGPQKQHPPGLMIDTSSPEEPSTSPVSPLSSAELVEAPSEAGVREEERPASRGQPSTKAPSWSDAHLRAYLEDGSEIRDLLLVVHNKANVQPAPPDHPLVKNLFQDENRKLEEMSTRLDGLLGDWLAKRSKTRPP
ncbi:MAG: hypothetical protein Q9200_005053 [Gallowayella weberi]